jgi:hypothetical protein
LRAGLNEHKVQPLTRVTNACTSLPASGGGGKMHTTPITAAQLAALVAGAKKPHLIEPLRSGVWLRVHVATVTSFAQQFQP